MQAAARRRPIGPLVPVLSLFVLLVLVAAPCRLAHGDQCHELENVALTAVVSSTAVAGMRPGTRAMLGAGMHQAGTGEPAEGQGMDLAMPVTHAVQLEAVPVPEPLPDCCRSSGLEPTVVVGAATVGSPHAVPAGVIPAAPITATAAVVPSGPGPAPPLILSTVRRN